MISARRTFWGVLLVAAVADALLSPFYPQFFAAAFGDRTLLTPALYVVVCRTAMALGLPLWAYFARSVSPVRLLFMAQGAAGVLSLLSATTAHVGVFMALSFLAEACRSSYLLVYALLIRCTPEEKRGMTIGWVVLVVNAAAILSAVAAGVMLEHLGSRSALVLTAVADFVQLAILASGFLGRRASEPSLADEPTGEGPSRDVGIVVLCSLAFLSAFGVVLLRPHFTTYVEHQVAPGMPLWLLGVLFVVPNAMALVALPFAGRATATPRPHLLLAASFATLGAGALLQGYSHSAAALGASRAVYGLSLAMVDITLDYAVLSSEKNALGRFGYVSASQSLAIIAAPLVAGYVADHFGWRWLFALAALVALTAAAMSSRLRAAPALVEQRSET